MKPRVLYISHRVPLPTSRDDRGRTWNILKFLSERAYVDLACLADQRLTDASMSALQSVTRRLAIIPHGGPLRYVHGALSLATGGTVTEGWLDSKRLATTVRDWNIATRYTAAMASSSGMARYVQKPFAPSVERVWIDLSDADSQKWRDCAKSSRFPISWGYRLEARRLRQQELTLAGTTNRMLVVSGAERRSLLDVCPDALVHAIGNGVDSKFFTLVKHDIIPHSCVFVGDLDDPLNSESVRWFAKTVWPKVRQRFSDSTFRIVGTSPGTNTLELSALPGVTVVGPVADVRPWLNESSCVVVPSENASGIQNKVLDAMACGRPVVCSASALKGLRVEPGLQFLHANSSDEWVNSITTVFNDPNLASELGIAASAWVQIHHLWDACLEPLNEMFDIHVQKADPTIEVTP
jgi:polysaccharide biosynthesis protein PslH